eukprot:TRINITY_DN11118_c0_g2_i1.p1 TRINITY_DN11118_c0_g2~~TRINITY_DN11118_c0_g2_i1.p1  ORF type:complete len:368 (-),score=66.40 TRINITY_DN11118_c0_g2_i1:239-1342(-)
MALKRPAAADPEEDSRKRAATTGAIPKMSSAKELGISVQPLNGTFGALVTLDSDEGDGSEQRSSAARVAFMLREDVGAVLRDAWHRHGVLVIRGLEALTPQDIVTFSAHFGEVEQTLTAARAHAKLPDVPVLRLGNVRDGEGKLISVPNSTSVQLPPNGSCQYRPAERLPTWHTDGTHRARKPIGSAFFCRRAPDVGGETCFADAATAWDVLSAEEQAKLESLECVCSLAHHDKKLQLRKADYPLLTPEQRLLNPPQRVPLVLVHPVSGRKSLYGFNSSTCCIVPKGTPVDQAAMDKYDLEGYEDPSVGIVRDLLPRFTTSDLTVVWKWKEGDLVVWDNRCTLHTGSGYDEKAYVREMWRTTIHAHL